jgi:hypothetical protein
MMSHSDRLWIGVLLISGCSPTISRDINPREVRARLDGCDHAKTIEEVKASVFWGSQWRVHDVDGMQILVGLSEPPSDGESRIDLHGYVLSRQSGTWNRFCLVKTRNVGLAEIGLDRSRREIYLLAKAETNMKGKRVLQIDLGTLSDDRGCTEGR